MLKLELVKASDGIYETVCSGISVEVMPLQSHSRSIIPSQKWMVFFDGFAITDDDFNALVEDLLASLDTLGVPYTAGTYDGGLPADQLIVALAGMHDDIVGH